MGERAAAAWLIKTGAAVFFPFPEHSDIDLIAVIDDRLLRVQIKTSVCSNNGRWVVQLSTRGGNQSWNGTIKYLDANRCDYVFALVGNGRQWFIPAGSLGGCSSIRLGGPKYAEFEVERGDPIARRTPPETDSRIEFPISRGDARVDKGIAL